MNKVFSSAMRQAMQLTRAQNLKEATRVVQLALSGRGVPDAPAEQPSANLRAIASAFAIPEGVDKTENSKKSEPESHSGARPRRPLGEVIDLLRHVDLPKFGRELGAICKSAQDALRSRRGGLPDAKLSRRGGGARL